MKFEIYKTKNGQRMWRLKADNGKIVADSSESYHNKQDIENEIIDIKLNAASAPIVDLIDR